MLVPDCNQDGEDESCHNKIGPRWQRTIDQEQRDTLENAKEATRQRTQEAQAAIRGNLPAYARREGYSSSLESDEQTPERTGETEEHELEDTGAIEKHQGEAASSPQPSNTYGGQGSSASQRSQDPGLAVDSLESNTGQQLKVIRRLEAQLICTHKEYDRLQLRYDQQVTRVTSLEEQIRRLEQEQEHLDFTENADIRAQ